MVTVEVCEAETEEQQRADPHCEAKASEVEAGGTEASEDQQRDESEQSLARMVVKFCLQGEEEEEVQTEYAGTVACIVGLLRCALCASRSTCLLIIISCHGF